MAVRAPLGLMVMEQLAQLGSTAKEPKFTTDWVAVTVIDWVLAEATGAQAIRQALTIEANFAIMRGL
ncbi:MAG: hypothetical protein Q8K71_14880 [Polaromonas sp.]|nr:hypothetical protein [Polaromonas sp.]